MSITGLYKEVLVTVEMDDPLRAVKEIFDHTPFHHLLVVERGKLFGVMSDRDLLRSISPDIGKATATSHDDATLNQRVHQVMSRHPVSLRMDASLHEAIEIFNAHSISCIPIVTQDDRPVGILSWRDIFNAIGSGRLSLTALTN